MALPSVSLPSVSLPKFSLPSGGGNPAAAGDGSLLGNPATAGLAIGAGVGLIPAGALIAARSFLVSGKKYRE